MIENPNRNSAFDQSAEAGIGGWLILPAVGLVVGPVFGVIGVVYALNLYSLAQNSGYGTMYFLELSVNMGAIIFGVYTAMNFFGKKRAVPTIFIAWLTACIVARGALMVIEFGAGAEVLAVESGKKFLRDIVIAALWIPYLKLSTRVKLTFVN